MYLDLVPGIFFYGSNIDRRPMIDNPPPLYRDDNGDLYSKALKNRKIINHGSTLPCT